MTTIPQAMVLLFNGWGYNWYRAETNMRADDLLVRSQLSGMLLEAGQHIYSLVNEYRQRNVPAPTREQPYPPKEVTEHLNRLKVVSKPIVDAETALRTASVPESDRVWAKLRTEGGLLSALLEADIRMAQAVANLKKEALALTVEDLSNPDIVDRIKSLVEPVKQAIDERAKKLSILKV